MNEYEKLLITPPYQTARKYGKTSFQLGREEGERKVIKEQLTVRFGTVSEEVSAKMGIRSNPFSSYMPVARARTVLFRHCPPLRFGHQSFPKRLR